MALFLCRAGWRGETMGLPRRGMARVVVMAGQGNIVTVCPETLTVTIIRGRQRAGPVKGAQQAASAERTGQSQQYHRKTCAYHFKILACSKEAIHTA